MSIRYEKPVIKDSPHAVTKKVETHPAYAQIGASRISCSGGVTEGAVLYGSDFCHQNFIAISVRASELHRGLSRDWPFGGAEYIEVLLSEAQWATFVSSLNIGTGVQCTLNHLNDESVPQIPEPPKRQDQFKQELRDRLAQAENGLKELTAAITSLTLSKKAREELQSKILIVKNNLTPNVQFVADSFAEHVEELTEKAKMETNAYIQRQIQRAGLQTLNAPRTALRQIPAAELDEMANAAWDELKGE